MEDSTSEKEIVSDLTSDKLNKVSGKNWFNPNVTSIVAIMIGLLSFWAALDQAKTSRRILYNSSLPIIHAGIFNSYSNTMTKKAFFEYGISNRGVGLAKIHWVHLYKNGKPYMNANNFSIFFQELANLKEPFNCTYSTVGNEGILRAGEDRTWITSQDSSIAYEVLESIRQKDSGFDLEICYSDIYDNYWKSINNTKVTPCKDCRKEMIAMK